MTASANVYEKGKTVTVNVLNCDIKYTSHNVPTTLNKISGTRR